ncbi:hypothetical protein [Bacteroides sp. RTP21281st1_E4_RTP21281_210402]|uniref:hypothetical protein n=1 Tax=unclassified Bacteroides TaxID=2646097 RepID=UPI0034A2A13B
MKKDNRSPKDIIQVFGTMLEERLIPIGFKFFKSTKTLKLTLKGYDLSFSLLSRYVFITIEQPKLIRNIRV